jgi:threonine dehydrogenase-like Zn-dependent dehydrogenase
MKDTAPQRATILVVDPDGDRRARILRDLGAEAECLSAETGAAALKECQDNFVEVAIVACGRNAPEGIPLLDEMAVHWPETVRIAIAEERHSGPARGPLPGLRGPPARRRHAPDAAQRGAAFPRAARE